MHIGMDTVELEGKGFEIFVKQEDQVKKGDLLVKFDLSLIKEAGYSTVTPIVVTNTPNYLDVLDMNQEDVLQGEDFLALSNGRNIAVASPYVWIAFLVILLKFLMKCAG